MQNNRGNRRSGNQQDQQPIRVITPRSNQLLGIIEERLGNRRSKVRCSDGNIRICRIPGRVRKRMWTREGDIVLIEPWSVQTNERGDLVYGYSKPQIEWLQKRGFLNWL
ncbi:MAG: translation initiation factor eIF-1A [Candidatus Altiarchaeota archaeon]|nr:translation initiation factor eIF-1A [Candidatus Altiarchaeota archaeon]